jgi:hypothetical protein
MLVSRLQVVYLYTVQNANVPFTHLKFVVQHVLPVHDCCCLYQGNARCSIILKAETHARPTAEHVPSTCRLPDSDAADHRLRQLQIC